jgi:hypothetical protein
MYNSVLSGSPKGIRSSTWFSRSGVRGGRYSNRSALRSLRAKRGENGKYHWQKGFSAKTPIKVVKIKNCTGLNYFEKPPFCPVNVFVLIDNYFKRLDSNISSLLNSKHILSLYLRHYKCLMLMGILQNQVIHPFHMDN